MYKYSIRWGAVVAVMAAMGGVQAPSLAQDSDHTASNARAMTTAPQKANGSGIALQYRVDTSAGVGQPVNVVLRFSGVTDPAGASVRFMTDPSLKWVGGPQALDLKPGQATDLTLTLLPGDGDAAYLHVFTTQAGAMSSVSVLVGEQPKLPNRSATLKTTPQGDKLISMPVK